MARTVSRGEIWTYRFKAPDKRRLVLVLTRQEVIGLLHTVIVAPIKSTIYGAPSEIVVGAGRRAETLLRGESRSRADVERARLVTYIGSVSPATMKAACRALAIATGCAD